MDNLPFAILDQQFSAQRDRSMKSKALRGGTNALKCSMAVGNICMKLIFGALDAF
jgi:hypothetical protein